MNPARARKAAWARRLVCLILAAASHSAAGAARPNIVYVLCDDLGYGDVHCLNPSRGKIPTPHIDRLAAQGAVFTDAHSGSSVCTPTRYGILTGRYAWRSRLQHGVLEGYSQPLIAATRLTVPALLRQHGYRTACIGKWHLGTTMPEGRGNLTVANGPVTRGFDSFFGISASLDMPPFAFIENDRFTQAPIVKKKWVREGAAAPDFEAVDVLPALIRKATECISARAAEAEPFFLYLALTSPHTPLVPAAEWRGKSGLGEYGDFVMQTDAALGEVLAALDRHGLADNTLVIFTSDNGFAPYVGADTLQRQGHFPSGDLRGYKADIWDGGHRVPFVARWPGTIPPGTRRDETICLTDLMATCAELVEANLPDDAGEDSVSFLPLLRGAPAPPAVAQRAVVHHSISGRFAIRQGPWKLALCSGSGGWSKPADGAPGLPPRQLYDLSRDPGEAHNVAAEHPELVARLTGLLQSYIDNGRSAHGPRQTNDVPVTVRAQ